MEETLKKMMEEFDMAVESGFGLDYCDGDEFRRIRIVDRPALETLARELGGNGFMSVKRAALDLGLVRYADGKGRPAIVDDEPVLKSNRPLTDRERDEVWRRIDAVMDDMCSITRVSRENARINKERRENGYGSNWWSNRRRKTA